MARDSLLASVRHALVRSEDDRAQRRGVVEAIRRTVPFESFAWLLTDPDTTVGSAPLAEVPCLAELNRLVALRYVSGRRWTDGTPGWPYRPVREGSELAHFLAGYGDYDLLSLTFADRFGCWGFLDLWRAGTRFHDDDVRQLSTIADPVTAALRRSRAAMFVPVDRHGSESTWSAAVLLLDTDLNVRDQTPEAETDLRALLPTEEHRQPIPAAAYNVAAQLLAVEAGVDDHRPVARTAVAAGSWISVRADRLGADIAVTVGPLAQRERWSLFCRTHGLTDRESEIVHLLAEGADTHTLVERLYLSEHTIQDHLKSVFAKTSVNSRRELLVRARGL